MKTYPGLLTLSGNLLASIDYETTGDRPGYHEIIQISIVPLDSRLEPIQDVEHFYRNVCPKYPERQSKEIEEVHQISMADLILKAPDGEKMKDMLWHWFKSLDLPLGKKLVPLAHNWAFEAGFTRAWLGPDMMDEIFHYHPRDAMITAISMNDRAIMRGIEIPFTRVGLGPMCNALKVHNPHPHDAYYDCLAEAEVYKRLLLMDQY